MGKRTEQDGMSPHINCDVDFINYNVFIKDISSIHQHRTGTFPAAAAATTAAAATAAATTATAAATAACLLVNLPLIIRAAVHRSQGENEALGV